MRAYLFELLPFTDHNSGVGTKNGNDIGYFFNKFIPGLFCGFIAFSVGIRFKGGL